MKSNFTKLVLPVYSTLLPMPKKFLTKYFFNPLKRKSTVVAVTILLGCGLQRASAQLKLNFGTNCALKSGTDKALNAVYLYTLVNDSLDCIVTVADIQGGAIIYSIDNNTITGSGGYGGTTQRFQPIISVPKTKNSTSYVKFHFQLIKKNTYNTSTKSGTNVTPSHMIWMRAYDIDGNGDDNGVKEFVEVGNAFIGAWPSETTTLVSKIPPIVAGDSSFSIKTSNSNGNNISDADTYSFNTFIYPNTTGAWDVYGGSYVGTNLPSISSGFDDGDRLNSWDFYGPAISPGADFGNTPYSYEKASASSSAFNPTYHIVSATAANVLVYLGSNVPDVDFDPVGDAVADNSSGTGGTDNGITSTNFTAYSSGNFSTTINATNKSTLPAYIYGYIDFNGNGFFDANERSNLVTVPANSINKALTITFSGGFTYNRASNNKNARFRTASSSSEIATPNGKASNGEVEDYIFTFNAILPLNSLVLSANQQSSMVKLTLTAKDENKVASYAWQQSLDGTNFTSIGTSPYINNAAASNIYGFTNIISGNSNVLYYRAVQYGLDGSSTFSNVVALKLNDKSTQLTAMPTLITDYTTVKIQSAIAENMSLHIVNNLGKIVMVKTVPVNAGSNTFAVDGWSSLSNGTYYLQMVGSESNAVLKVVVQH